MARRAVGVRVPHNETVTKLFDRAKIVLGATSESAQPGVSDEIRVYEDLSCCPRANHPQCVHWLNSSVTQNDHAAIPDRCSARLLRSDL